MLRGALLAPSDRVEISISSYLWAVCYARSNFSNHCIFGDARNDDWDGIDIATGGIRTPQDTDIAEYRDGYCDSRACVDRWIVPF